ncbi:MAG: hypothetical protein DWQ02_03080 [Bacteroidetes bacterium]|nr:MAG: hypothetical protein DWQ02_03080 [Bacteroidota bacterium]
MKGFEFILALRPITYQMDVNRLATKLGEGDKKGLNKLLPYPTSDSKSIHNRSKKSEIRYSGFIAQEVENTAKSLGYEFSGVDAPQNEYSFYGLRYATFVVPLVKSVQELNELNEDLTKRVENNEQTISSQSIQINALKAQNETLQQELNELKALKTEIETMKALINDITLQKQ